ncbi:MAG: hypothetical protein ACI3XL_04610 [Eubacteriales bacterium]
MKKIISVLLVLIMLLSLTSCEGYSATMLVKVNTNDYCSANWGTLEGTLVLNTTKKSGTAESAIHYTASLEEGELTVYYYVRLPGDKQKIELFTIKGGESIEDRGGYVEMNNNIQVIIETNGKTKGGSIKIDFE